MTLLKWSQDQNKEESKNPNQCCLAATNLAFNLKITEKIF